MQSTEKPTHSRAKLPLWPLPRQGPLATGGTRERALSTAGRRAETPLPSAVKGAPCQHQHFLSQQKGASWGRVLGRPGQGRN